MSTILLFGRLREEVGQSNIVFPEFLQGTVAELRNALVSSKIGDTHTFISGQALVAVNQVIVDDSHQIHSGDEIAIFPPVTGG